MPNQYERPNSSSKVISVILIIVIAVVGIILFMNKKDNSKLEVLENGTPVCLNTEFKKFKKGLFQHGMHSN